MLSGTIRLMVSAAPLLTFQSVRVRCTARCFSVRVCWRSPTVRRRPSGASRLCCVVSCASCCAAARLSACACWCSCSGSNSIVLGFSGSTVRTASVPSAKRTVMVSLLMLTL